MQLLGAALCLLLIGLIAIQKEKDQETLCTESSTYTLEELEAFKKPKNMIITHLNGGQYVQMKDTVTHNSFVGYAWWNRIFLLNQSPKGDTN